MTSHFRSLCNKLKRAYPDYNVSVLRCKTPNDRIGDCLKKNKNTFTIRVSKDLCEASQLHILLHEWGHMLAWEEKEDHGPVWGIRHSEVYAIFEEWLKDK